MASKRVLIVGGVAGGASCAARLRRLDETAEIYIFERGAEVSFANCGLPYYVGGVIENRQDLLVATPERFRDLFNIEVRTRHEVRRIDRESKTIEVKNLATGDTHEEAYDALVLAPGAAPMRPLTEGLDLPGVFTLRNMQDVDAISHWLDHRRAQRAVVVGGGFIGLEMVENLAHRGMEVVLLEMLDQVMAPLDHEMVVDVHQAFRDHGVELHLSNGLKAIEPGKEDSLTVISQKGQRFTTDAVIVSVGVRPETGLAEAAGLKIGQRGGIQVDSRMRTSDPSIWAVGDAIEVRDVVTGQWGLCALAGPANRQGRVAAGAISGRDDTFRGVQGTAVVGIFGMTVAMTGASEKTLRALGLPFEKSYTFSNDHAGYYPGAEQISMKLLFDPQTGRVLGAQAVGKAGVEKRIDVLAMAIQKEATIADLEEAELCYAPQYGSAKDPINIAGFVAGNVLRGDVELAHWDEWFARRSNGHALPMVIDVRPPEVIEELGEVPGSVKIPLSQLRRRLDQLPRDQEIWLHCNIGQTAYYAARILAQEGFQTRNLSGGFFAYRAAAEKHDPG